jgi:hypothetical protein
MTPTLTLRHPVGIGPELEWIATELLERRLGLHVSRTEGPSTGFELGDGRRTLRLASDFFEAVREHGWRATRTMPQVLFATFGAEGPHRELLGSTADLPILYGRPTLTVSDERIEVGVDILGTALFMMSRYEETVTETRDDRDRFPAKASVAVGGGFLERPIVDELVELLRRAVNRLWPGATKPMPTPTVTVTCDVDWPARYALAGAVRMLTSAAADVVQRRSPRPLLLAPTVFVRARRSLDQRDPYVTFGRMMDACERRGLRAAFYFFGGWSDPSHPSYYDLGMPAMRALLRSIHQRGHEIGLHPSHRAYREPAVLRAEADRLRSIADEEGIRQESWGGRMHWLRWHTPTTLYGWKEAGMRYDSTLGYADRAGFRCGTCHPFRAFDPVARQPVDLELRPLIAMDVTLLNPRYMGLGEGADTAGYLRRLRSTCAAVGGNFVLLWHNSKLVTKGQWSLFEAAIDG